VPELFLHGRRRRRDLLEKSPIAPAARSTESPERRAARQTLGLSSYATKDEVKRAYRDLVRTTHPDLHPRASAEERRELSRRLHAITSAYQTLVA
jgi:DnaJ-class molecular chaperone